MYKLLGSIFSTSTFRQSSITFTATLINGTLGALFYIITARFLGPSNFGLMMIAVTTLTLMGDIGDLGTNTGIVRFVGKYAKFDKEKAKRILKLGLKVKLVVAVFAVTLGFFVSPLLAKFVFVKQELSEPLRIAFLGVASYLLFTFVISALQAFQRFVAWSALQIGTNLFRLVLALVLISLGVIGVDTTLLIYSIVPFLGFIVAFRFIPLRFWGVKEERKVAGDFFQYNKWVASFLLVAAIGARLDTFISGRLLSSTQVGIYSAANQLVQIIPQIVVAISTVVAPKMASMSTISELIEYIKKVQAMVLGIAVWGILSLPLIVYLIPLIYGPSYLSSVSVFLILFLAMLTFLIAVPVHNSIFYYFSYPKFFFYLSLGHTAIVAILGWILISSYGIMGGAFTVLIGQIFSFITPLIWVFRKIRQSQITKH